MRTSLGPYQLVRRIGHGGMAEVFLATAYGAAGFARQVAIKTLAPELVGEPELERALIREATLAGRLHHRNLVAVLGLGVDDGLTYVVMELVDRGDLATAIESKRTLASSGAEARRGSIESKRTLASSGAEGRRGSIESKRTLASSGAMPDALAVHVAHEIALGLAYLHAARDERGLPLGIVHRDVTPHNVLVSSTGDVKLADFGVAKATALVDLTAAGARRGKYAYMAPEQLAGEPLTPAADQFGLAVTLVELATGARPFAGDTPWATMDAIRNGAPALGTLAPDLAAIATRALAPLAADRFASLDELRAALAAAARARVDAGPVELAAWLAAR